jgi:hypothetical protein
MVLAAYFVSIYGGGHHSLNAYLKSGNSHRRGRLSTVDLLVISSLDQQLLKLQTIFSYFTKQATLMRRSTVLSLPLQ